MQGTALRGPSPNQAEECFDDIDLSNNDDSAPKEHPPTKMVFGAGSNSLITPPRVGKTRSKTWASPKKGSKHRGNAKKSKFDTLEMILKKVVNIWNLPEHPNLSDKERVEALTARGRSRPSALICCAWLFLKNPFCFFPPSLSFPFLPFLFLFFSLTCDCFRKRETEAAACG